MRREDSSTVLTVIFSLLISLCITTEVEARTLVQVCSSSCGDIQNISYPFRLKGDPAGCGDPDYELSCENNKTIFEFHRGNYYVRQISYEKQTIRVVDVNLASGSCGLPNRSLSLSEVNGDSRYRGFVYNIYTNFVNCSTVISDPSYRQVPCLSGNTSHVYVIYDDYRASGFHDSCVFISMVPTVHVSGKYPSYGAIQKLLETGFDLGWSVECRDCLESGDSCVITKWEIPLQYECDRPGQILSTLLSTLDSTLESFILGTQILEENSGENFFELCQATRCGKKGPIIRYPFRLNTQPSFCGREGFELSCSGDNTLLRLPFSGNYYIQQIIYTHATISIMHVNDTKCPLQSLLSLNLSNSQFYVGYSEQFSLKTFTVVNCTEKDAWSATDKTLVGPIDCIGDEKILVYVTDASASMDKLPSPCRTYQTAEILTPCESDLRRAIERLLRTREIFIQWLDSGTCVACEKSGNHCGFNATGNETICYPNRQKPKAEETHDLQKQLEFLHLEIVNVPLFI
ncbi:hypothetical protein L1049_006824 [Liquidambar formosana]|uniref:Wall-associated receptor kinase galacturonan-binding domain-containing protein n=1 Tax=Liquidambar formosana TaxID=63359 RepID=A0AAP0WRW1_LIQFO